DAAHVAHVGLAAELPFGADLAGNARNFRGERVELVDHRVDRLFELANFAAHIDRDLAREIAVRDRGRDVCDVADLVREIARHRVDVVGEILPYAAHAFHFGLAAE